MMSEQGKTELYDREMVPMISLESWIQTYPWAEHLSQIIITFNQYLQQNPHLKQHMVTFEEVK